MRRAADAATRSAMRALSWNLARQAGLPTPRDDRSLSAAVSDARAILVVALAESGDMVLLSPFMRELRRHAASARITLVCLPMGAGLFEASADVDEVVPYQASVRRMLRPFVLPRRARELTARRLRGPFDLAIVPRWDTDQHLASAVAVFSGAPRRVAHAEQSNPRKRLLNAGFDALYTDLVLDERVAHEVDRHVVLLRALGAEPLSDALQLSLTSADRERAAAVLADIPRDRVLVAMGIGAAHPKRRWPVERFIEVARTLAARAGAHVVIVGGPGDVAAQDQMLHALGPGATGLAGRLTLRESAAVMERCALFVGDDSAPMHLAAAAGIACVEISCHPASGDPLHNNAPERFAPWRVPGAVLRPARPVAPCVDGCAAHRPHCILEVSVSAVVDACRALLRETRAPRALEPTRV